MDVLAMEEQVEPVKEKRRKPGRPMTQIPLLIHPHLLARLDSYVEQSGLSRMEIIRTSLASTLNKIEEKQH